MSSVILTPWQPPPVDNILKPGDVHLWRFRLTASPSESLLDVTESLRAERLRIPEKARAFVVARTRLRQILGFYLNIPPIDVQFTYNDNGKPFLKEREVHFNLSHSGPWAICVVSRELEVGTDLEFVSKELDTAKLACRSFSPAEKSWLNNTPEYRRRRNFFRLWTRKEAWLKGKGGGFSELNLELGRPHITSTASWADGWCLMNLPVARHYVGAVAVSGKIDKILRLNWQA